MIARLPRASHRGEEPIGFVKLAAVQVQRELRRLRPCSFHFSPRPRSLHFSLRPCSLHFSPRPCSLHFSLRPRSLHFSAPAVLHCVRQLDSLVRYEPSTFG